MAESHRDEIARLEALHASNPEGRVFTHLAEAYRRAGEVARAREILTEGLGRHPDYPSAHVVLGRVLLEVGEAEEAGAAFRRVLELDRYNVVALRSLGELALNAGRVGEALHYHEELYRLDPGNEVLERRIRDLRVVAPPEPTLASWSLEAEATRGEVPGRGDVPSEVPEPSSGPGQPWTAEHEDRPATAAQTEQPDRADAAEMSGAAEKTEDPALEGEWVPQDRWDWFTEESERGTGGSEPGLTTGSEAEFMSSLENLEPTIIEDAMAEDPHPAVHAEEEVARGAGELQEPGSGMEGQAPLPVEDQGLSPEHEAAGVEAAAVGSGVQGVAAEDEMAFEDEGEFEASAEAMVAIGVEGGAPEGTGDDAMDDELLDEWVTETMAEVYAAQGLTERAVEVYRRLRQDRPDDARLAARLVELEEALAGPSSPGMAAFAKEEDDSVEAREAWLARVEAAWTGGEGAVGHAETLYSWSGPQAEVQHEGPSIGEVFRGLLGWRPSHGAFMERSQAEATRGASPSTGPPSDMGLSELLLEEAVEESRSGPIRGDSDPGAIETAFDEWFGGGQDGGETDAPEFPPPPPSHRPRPPSEAESAEDLEMFRSWLRSLKK